MKPIKNQLKWLENSDKNYLMVEFIFSPLLSFGKPSHSLEYVEQVPCDISNKLRYHNHDQKQ